MLRKNKEKRQSSEVLESVIREHTEETITLEALFQKLHEQGFGFIMLLLGILAILTPPGATLVTGTPILFFAWQMLAGRDVPWLPGWLRRKTLKRSMLETVVRKTAPAMRRVERIIHPRFYPENGKRMERMMGVFSLVFAASIMVPLPMTNFLPGVGIILMSLGLLGKDGLVIGLGVLVGTFGTVVAIVVVLSGVKAVEHLWQLAALAGTFLG